VSRKKPAPVVLVGEIAEGTSQSDGTRIRAFRVGGVRVLVVADSDHDPAAAALVARLHAVCSIPPAPPRIEAWGLGQFDRVQLAPGVEAWLRITPEGRVRMVVPGGDLDVTDGSASLGTGLHEAGARAAQIRVRREEQRRKRAEGAASRPRRAR
jgi:hypothetical protein